MKGDCEVRLRRGRSRLVSPGRASDSQQLEAHKSSYSGMNAVADVLPCSVMNPRGETPSGRRRCDESWRIRLTASDARA